MPAEVTRVELYVDPCCTFAWIAYRWLVQVRRRQAIDLRLHLMSLAILNQGRDILPQYRRLLALTWRPARVAAAAEHHHGQAALVGRQVWNRQRNEEVLHDVDDVALGHETKLRWNGPDKWI